MKNTIISVIAAAVLFSWSCNTNNPKNMELELKNFIKQLEGKLVPLSIEYGKASYIASVSGKESDYKKTSDLNVQITKLFTNKNDFALLKKIKESGQIKDSVLNRELNILYLSFLGNQTDTSKLEETIKEQSAIENAFSAFRTVVKSKLLSDNQIDSIFHNSKNSEELEMTWKASKKIGETVAPDLIKLVKKRNEIAKDLGFSNFHQMSLELSEQNPAEVEALFDELDTLTREAFINLKGEIDTYLSKRFSIPVSKLMPWHYQNRFFQEAPAIYSIDLDKYYSKADILTIIQKYYAGLEMPVEDIIKRSDLYEKPGKNQHAFCTDIDHSGDVRILVNIRNNAYWTNTILHELGHSVYSKYNDATLPFLLRDAAHQLTTEGIAMMFGRFYSNPYWMRDNLGISNQEIDKIKKDCKRTLRLDQLVFSRWNQVMFRFEKSMYENPDQDLNKLWWNLVEKYQMIKCPEGRNEPDWASKIHIATVPCYYHNYLMGELYASQLYCYISENILGSGSKDTVSFTGKPEVGKFLVEKIFKPGRRYEWNSMIEKATGHKLTAKYYALQFVQE